MKPEITVPKSLGGGTIAVFCCRGPKPEACTVPGCGHYSTTSCQFPLRNAAGKTCGKKLCGRHVKTDGVGKGCCPAHVRFLERQASGAANAVRAAIAGSGRDARRA